ncbi:MAG TPA: GTPase Era [Pseudomonadales bacterium]
MSETPQRCGYVALVGRPNVGKSTLLNHLLRFKLAITSRKPQTTRHVLLGVDTEGTHQAVYVDTPGIHDHARREMNRRMVRAATAVLADVDLIVMVVDRDVWTPGDQRVLELLQARPVPRFVAMNKVDLMPRKEALLPAIAAMQERGFEEIFPISALKGHGLDELRRSIFARLPEQPHLFPPDQITDLSERFLVSEIIREKLMRRLGDEVPHHLTVMIRAYEETERLVDIAADIVVERPGQKRIVIGQGGERLKQIGSDARRDIEALLERQVMLRLWVKVRPGWSESPEGLRRVGYDPSPR